MKIDILQDDRYHGEDECNGININMDRFHFKMLS